MADFAVVVVLGLIISIRTGERSAHEKVIFISAQALEHSGEDSRDYVLMFIVRKLNQKLAGGRRITKRETCFISRRYLRVATAANYRSCAFEKLLAMTTHAGSMTRKVCNIGKLSYLFPVNCGNFVASVAGTLVFLCSVGEPRIVYRRHRGPLHRWFAHALLRLNWVVKTNSGEARHRTQDCQENKEIACLAPEGRDAYSLTASLYS